MQIVDASLQLGSYREFQQRTSSTEQLQVFGPEASTPRVTLSHRQESLQQEFQSYGNLFGRRPAPLPDAPPASRAALPAVIESAAAPSPTAPPGSAAGLAAEPVQLLLEEVELLLLKRLLEALTGREIHLPERISSQAPESIELSASELATAGDSLGGLRYESSFSYAETELTAFSISGELFTADGERVELDFELLMARSFSFTSSTRIEIGTVPQKDPLVLSFGGGRVELSQQRVDFDLDGDGADEQVAFASGNSAFLALDRNRNGRIDDGGELFGAASGDGFAELALFDQDGNGFIDEGDPVFASLLLLRRATDGGLELQSAAQAGVGALYLETAPTPFELRDSANALLGSVRNSSIFLKQDLGVGSLAQVDLVV